jgi:hypothetical protein
MPPPFHPLTVDQFAAVLRKATVRRRIDVVHLHHTWRPAHKDYTGHDTIVAMWRFHTGEQGWRDIAQHLSIAPDGTLWTGRPWDWPPASASGHNGNNTAGPFMIETIGNFDAGQDPFEGDQREAVLDTVAHLLLHFKLTPAALRFHRDMTDQKSCPGTSLDREELREAVAARMEEIEAARAEEPRGTIAPFSDEMDAVYDVLASFSAARRAPGAEEELPEADEELAEERTPIWQRASGGVVGSRDIDTVAITPEVLAALRPHVINLSNGRLTESGKFTTSLADVAAIFEEHLPRALQSALAANRPLRVVLYAHGGLVSEEEGLRGALKHVDWWVKNNVYPLYFVWETGVIETLRSLISGAREARDITDFTDTRVEELARRGRADRLWTGMKENARRATDADGGGTIVASRLAEFCKTHGAAVQVHAVGHSAGSILHAFLLPAALDAGVPAVQTLHFLAPAIRVDTFMERLSPRLGTGIGPLTMYTMRDDFERDDNVASFYRKSLLYLIHFALEDVRRTPILGLDISVRDDIRLKRLFGINPPSTKALGEIVFSRTEQSSGRRASQSTSHGGFDDDPATMNSVARRVLGVEDTTAIVEFVRPKSVVSPSPSAAGIGSGAVFVPMAAPTGTPLASSTGARRALCVGINEYRRQPLSGCVADAQAWAQTLRGLQFSDVRILTDAQATRQALLQELQGLVARSAPGDILVFQFSGHGTTLPDRNADEAGGDTPQHDEAICPFDFTEGHFLLDDDLASVYGAIPQGVSVTNFIDCCHSGSITRFGFGMRPAGSGAGDERPRFITVDPEIVRRHLAFRASRGGRAARGSASMKEVLFAACRSNELAWESNGQGDFTRAATALLRAGTGAMTNQDFETRVIGQLGSTPRQHPELDCAPAARTQPLLAGGRQALSASPIGSAAGLAPPIPAMPGDRAAAVAGVLDAISVLLRQ